MCLPCITEALERDQTRQGHGYWGGLHLRYGCPRHRGQVGSRGLWGHARPVHGPTCRFNVLGAPPPSPSAGPPPLRRRRWAAAAGQPPPGRRRRAAAAGPPPLGRRRGTSSAAADEFEAPLEEMPVALRLTIIDRVRRSIPQGRGRLTSRNESADRGRELMAAGPPPLELSLN